MASCNWKLMKIPLPPEARESGLSIKRPAIVATNRAPIPLQVKSESGLKSRAQISFALSRRDVTRYVTAEALVGFALLFTEPADARVGRLENKKKVMEKLEKLREEAGVSKPKSENGTKATPKQPPKKGNLLPLGGGNPQ